MELTDNQLKKIVDEVVSGLMRNMPSDVPSVARATAAPIAAKLETANKIANAKNVAENRIVAIGTDHGGVQLKETLKVFLTEKGFEINDCGTHSTDAVDYPDIAKCVATKVADRRAWRGIVIDGAGIGSCMAANKVKGIRAALCYDQSSANNAREHNDANVLTLGAGLIGTSLAKQIAETFLKTDFAGGRHAPRVAKIMEIE